MDRRHFLKLTIGTTTGAVIGSQLIGSAFSSVLGLDDGPFQYGVASGDPLPNGIVIWTRVTPSSDSTPGSGRGRPVRVEWVIADDPGLMNVVRKGTERTDAGRDHTVKVDIRSLRPGRTYFYAFHHAGVTSPTGRFRTAPRPGVLAEQLRFGHVSCSNYAAGYFAAYRHLAARDDLDFVLHVGDYIYEYEDGGYGSLRPLDPPTEIVTLSDYRRRFALYRSDPDLRALHERHAFVTTIDDHEITNDAWSDGAENHDAGEGDYVARRNAALQAYDEWMPLRIKTLGGGTRLYRSLRFGALADLTMLDLRQYRSQQVTDFAEAADPGRTMLGDPQAAWLNRQLSDVDAAQWQLFGNSVQLMQVRYPLGFLPDGEGTTRNVDAWDGYGPSRSDLLSKLAERADRFDPVFLTGDIHSSWAADLRIDFDDPSSTPVGTEFVATSVTSDNLNEIVGLPPRNDFSLQFEQGILALNDHVKLIEFDSHGYSVVDVTPERVQSDWYFLSDRADPQATSSFAFARSTTFGSKSLDAGDGLTPLG